MIRDRIVVGISDVKLSEKLQLNRELTLEKAITQVRQQELIKEQQSTLRGSGREGTVSRAEERAPRDKSRQPHSRKTQQSSQDYRELPLVWKVTKT